MKSAADAIGCCFVVLKLRGNLTCGAVMSVTFTHLQPAAPCCSMLVVSASVPRQHLLQTPTACCIMLPALSDSSWQLLHWHLAQTYDGMLLHGTSTHAVTSATQEPAADPCSLPLMLQNAPAVTAAPWDQHPRGDVCNPGTCCSLPLVLQMLLL